MINKFIRGKGIFRMNKQLLENSEYLKLVNKLIDEEIIKYAVPVYDYNVIKNISGKEIQFTIDDELFLEVLLLRIRGETIKFSANLKKNKNAKEKKLISDIKQIEESDSLQQLTDILYDKKEELQEIRNQKLTGHIVRSRIQCLGEYKKPTKYFCSLDKS